MRRTRSGPPAVRRYYYSLMASPLGTLGLVATDNGLCEIRTRVADTAAFRRYLQSAYPAMPSHQPAKTRAARHQLAEYFKGQRTRFTCALDLAQGTPFQRRVWRSLLKIPYGQTRSYAWLARAIGQPRAARAVGNANGNNPVPIIVPCHRVIRENGALGGYTGGLHKKRFLLRHEGV